MYEVLFLIHNHLTGPRPVTSFLCSFSNPRVSRQTMKAVTALYLAVTTLWLALCLANKGRTILVS